MKRLQHLIRTFFGFSRTETNAFLLFIPLIGVILFSEPVYRQFTRDDRVPFENISKTDSLYALFEMAELNLVAAKKKRADTTRLHSFDPNLATESEFIALDLPKGLATRIVRYRKKGGKFRQKDDVLKIFGMDSGWYKRAKPWMVIETQKQNSTYSAKASLKQNARDDINTADSTQLDAVYGIGRVLARRILQFRDRLGGFISMEQLREVYGLDTVVVKNLGKRFEVKEGFQPRKLILNEVSLEALMAHPYVSRREAQAILAYRTQHGAFDSLAQLKEIKLIDAKWVERMRNYLGVKQIP